MEIGVHLPGFFFASEGGRLAGLGDRLENGLEVDGRFCKFSVSIDRMGMCSDGRDDEPSLKCI